jgi:hypothetical protein
LSPFSFGLFFRDLQLDLVTLIAIF